MGNVSFRIEENRVIIGHWFNLDRVENPVILTWTDCNYGGKRPWFICPGRDNSRSCGKRVAFLYSDGCNFLCRHCYNLTYQCRNESQSNRLMRRARKIRERLGASNDLLKPIWDKPKHMHWETFETLWLEARLTGLRGFALGLAAIEKNFKSKTHL